MREHYTEPQLIELERELEREREERRRKEEAIIANLDLTKIDFGFKRPKPEKTYH